MSTLKLRRYNKPSFLKGLGRELLETFLARFTNYLDVAKIHLPSCDLPDDDYFKALAKILFSPEGLPDELNEVLYALEEMSSAEAEERMREAVAAAGVEIAFRPDSTGGDVAMQVWLAAPELLAKAHNEQKVLRLATFEHFPSKVLKADRLTFTPLTDSQLEKLSHELDEWFVEHNRGKGSSRIDVYRINGKWWFVVRHGDRFQRTPVVQKEKTEILHFRPEKDDVIVFDEELDELSVHAETKGEKSLYCEKFGFFLRADDHYFVAAKTYTLEPLRTEKEDALDVRGITGLNRIVLRELEVAWPGTFHAVNIRRADNLFEEAQAREKEAIPMSGRLVRAAFDVYFDGCAKPRKVQIRAGNILKLGRHCDADLVNQWLCKSGFRVAENDLSGHKRSQNTLSTSLLTPLPGAERGTQTNVESVANN
jgi:hypothetical protein